MPETQSQPLSGLVVVDLSTEIAGPYATKMLCDAGARVIKIESSSGDPLRQFTSSKRDLEGRDAALFQFLNGGKESVVWDLESKLGRDRLFQLCTRADLVVESGGPGWLEARGLDFEAMRG